MKCNIDARGKAVRLLLGILFALAGGVVLVAGAGTGWGLPVGLSCIGGGAFMIFEGASGWCAVRAMGFKTKI